MNKMKDLDEKSFLKLAMIMAGVVMIFCAVSAIFSSYGNAPKVPHREATVLDAAQPTKNISKEAENANNQPISAAESIVDDRGSPVMLPNMRPVYEKNSDVVGWIKIEGTCIDYPVMYTKNDSEFYLYKNFYKNKDINGSIFIDSHCSLNPRDTNLIFHGHNMNNGSMFGALIKYKSREFYNSHRYVLFDTLYESQVYEVISVFISKVYNMSDNVFKYYRFYNAEDEEDFNYFYDNIKGLSMYEIDLDAEYGDEFITLSTCENSIKNGRFVVVAKRI